MRPQETNHRADLEPAHYSSQSSGIGKGVRLGSLLALGWERLWPLLVPTLLVGLVFAIFSWLGGWDRVPVWGHIAIVALLLAAFAGALFQLRKFVFPTSEEVSRRIEIETGLLDRPIGAQFDAMAMGDGDAFSTALWNEHRTRMQSRLDYLSSGSPNASGSRFDPYGLRLFLPILAFIAFMVSFGTDGGRISDVMRLGGDPAQLLSRLDVWVNPPNYTQKAPVYLSVDGTHQQGKSLKIPYKSVLVGRFAGEGDISLKFNSGAAGEVEIKAPLANDKSDQAKQERHYQFQLTESGIVSVYARDTKIAEWSLNIIADTAPEIAFEGEPAGSLSGSLQLSYRVKDDYGVVRASGLVKPLSSGKDGDSKIDWALPAKFIAPANARSLIEPLTFKLALPRRRAKSGVAKLSRDLTKHPLAGSTVVLTLIAEDDAGQKGMSAPKEIELPGRNFSHPVARALIEQRRILALDANQKNYVVRLLDAVSIAPEKYIDDFTAHLAIRIAYRKLVDAKNDDQLRDVMDLMWDVALGIEFGKMSQAEQRLREAQEKLSDALERGASDKEISKLMRELRQAMNELMQALAEQARQNPQANNQRQNDAAQTLRQRDLERMLDRIENLAKSGSKDAARQLLSEMQRMMDNLRAGRHQQQRRAEGNQTNEALNQLSDLMQKQQKLMDETFRMEQQRPREGGEKQNQQGQQNPNGQKQQQGQRDQKDGDQKGGDKNGEEMTAQEYADALEQMRDQQKALQEQLDGLNQQLEELGLEPSEQFGEAGKQMGKAGEQLGKGSAGKATGNQGKALQALRKGAQQMMQQMAGDRQQGGQKQGSGSSRRNSRMGRDPLGRNQGSRGFDFGDDTKIPGEIDAQRAREILEAIRKRLSEPEQKVIEKDYLERLLKSQ